MHRRMPSAPGLSPSPRAGPGASYPRSEPDPSWRVEVLCVAAACAFFLLLVVPEALRQTYPYFDDVTYLRLGNDVHSLGGPLGLLRALFAGTFAESNRHPLYLAVLGLVAHPRPAYHREAQLLTAALGVLALLACYRTARRHLGVAAATLLALLLAVSRTLVACSAREGCEPLLVIFWALAVGAVLDGVGLGGGASRRRLAWLRGGVYSGLAYLTKGTGLFLPASLALTFLVEEGWRAVLDRRAYAYAAGFLAASSPLLVRNQRMFGFPFYNFNLGTLWHDQLSDFAETFAPQAKLLVPHGFLDYLRHLTPGALVERVAVGVGETVYLLADAMAPTGGSPHRPLFLAVYVIGDLLGALAVVLALRQLFAGARGFGRSFLLVHAGFTALFLFVFSVNGTGNTRYFLPLAATVLMPALAARVVEDVRAAGSFTASGLGRAVGGVAMAAVAAGLIFHGPRLEKPGMAEVRDWLVARLAPGDTYAVDARSHLQLEWLAPEAHQLIVSASWRDLPVDPAVLEDYLRANRVRYVVLDASSVAHLARPGDPAGRRYLFYQEMPLEADGSLPREGVPKGFRIAYEDPGSPRRWMVLEATAGR